MLLYAAVGVGIPVLYACHLEKEILFHSVLFVLCVLVTAQSLKFYNERYKWHTFFIASVLPFVLYVGLWIKWEEVHFVQYKMLFVFPLFLAVYQMTRFVRIGSTKRN